MAARTQMDHNMSVITTDLLNMTRMVEETIYNAVRSLKEKDGELARAVIDGDEKIDDIEEEIADKTLKFLATQQPLAGDLRMCISILQLIRDLERIGDHCEDIAKYTLRLENQAYMKELVDIPRMADMAAKMVKNAIDAFVNRDLRLARKVWIADEDVDELFRTIHEELLGLLSDNAMHNRQSVMFLFIASHLERIADYATNICEETVFAIEGIVDMEKERSQGPTQ